MSYTDSTSRPDLVPNDIEYSRQSTSSYKDTMMNNLNNLSHVKTDYLIPPFYNKEKLVDNVLPYSKDDDYDYEERENTEESSENKTESSSKTGYTDDTKKTQTQAPHHQQTQADPSGSKYQSQFNKANDNVEDSKNKFRQQVGGKVFNSAEEELLAKYDIMQQLAEMAQFRGVKLSQNYTIKSNYEDMLRERNLHKYIKDKHEGTKWLSEGFFHLIKGIEKANGHFDPFGFNLDGWSDHVKGNLNDHYGTFSELYEKYVGPGVNIAPELKLAFAMCSSAATYHYFNSALQVLPNLNDEENQDIVRELREKAKAESKVADDGIKAFFDEKHDKANEQLRYLQLIKEGEREQEAENRRKGFYDDDNKTEKSVRLEEIQSERERHYRFLEELDRLEENAKQMKSVAGSTYTRDRDRERVASLNNKRTPNTKSSTATMAHNHLNPPRTVEVVTPKKVVPIRQEATTEDTRTTQTQTTIPFKMTHLVNKYSQPKISKPTIQPIATTIAPPVINNSPNQIITRTQPRVHPQYLNNQTSINNTVQTEMPIPIPTSTPTSASTDLNTNQVSTSTNFGQTTLASPAINRNLNTSAVNISSAANYQSNQIQNSSSLNNYHEMVRNTKESPNSVKITNYDPNIISCAKSETSSRSKSSVSSNNESVASILSNSSSNSRSFISLGSISTKSTSSISKTSNHNRRYNNAPRITVISERSSSVNNNHSESSIPSITSLPTHEYREIVKRNDETNNKIIPVLNKKSSDSNSGSSGKVSQRSVSSAHFSGGSISTIKSKNGKKKRIVSIVTKPSTISS